MTTTPDAVYDALAAAVATTGVAYTGRILFNEQTPRTSRTRNFWVIPTGWVIAPGMVAQLGYKWITETVLIRVSHTFKGKRQDESRTLAYADSLAIAQAVDTNAALLGLCGSAATVSRAGPALSSSGDFIVTDLAVDLTYQVALPAIA